jgi:peptidoglycan/xylan/chitin deacetylase (PgdA/CDA1 family)
MWSTSRVRHLLRRAALDTLALGSRLGDATTDLRRPRIHILHLHGLGRGGEAGLRATLERLARDHAFISYSEAVDRVVGGPVDAPYLALSFDDGLADCVPAAAIAAEFGVKAMFFVCPALVGSTAIAEVGRALRRQTDGLELPMTWDDLEELRQAGHEIGSHGMTHRSLAELEDDRLAEEITAPLELLRSRLGDDVEHFAWPYGRFGDMSPRAAGEVIRAGYASCASGVRGCHTVTEPQRSSLCLRREHIEADWPLSHVLYFLARSSRRSTAADNGWPPGWNLGGTGN